MGIYLCVFDGDEELEGVEAGSYEDFGALLDLVAKRLEHGAAGSRFPALRFKEGSDEIWSPVAARALAMELQTIERELSELPAEALSSGWKREVAKLIGLQPRNLAECYFDIDGEPLLPRLADLCRVAADRNLPILSQ